MPETVRLYHADPRLREFRARILEKVEREGRPAVVLDRTCFYPTSGGQPHDTGLLQGIPVLDVQEEEEGNRIFHILERLPEGDEVACVIDWDRRFYHMQQHTGQHILSECFVRLYEAATIGFHLGEEDSTIDLDAEEIGPRALSDAERMANRIIQEDRDVQVRDVGREELKQLRARMRGVPEDLERVRLVEVSGFDLSACGGTHVAKTGEIGLLKILSTEKIRGKERIRFVCGLKALEDYGRKNEIVARLCSVLSSAPEELDRVVEKRLSEQRELRKRIEKLQEELRPHAARKFLEEAVRIGKASLLVKIFDSIEPDEAKQLCMECARVTPSAVFFAHKADKARLFFAVSPGLPLHAGKLVKRACEILGGKGGGKSEFAEGGAACDLPRLEEALGSAAGEATELLKNWNLPQEPFVK
jgi:alanyl-tRNA synthetase